MRASCSQPGDDPGAKRHAENEAKSDTFEAIARESHTGHRSHLAATPADSRGPLLDALRTSYLE